MKGRKQYVWSAIDSLFLLRHDQSGPLERSLNGFNQYAADAKQLCP
jgi:hypothetical protein